MLEKEQIENILKQVDDCMGTIRSGQMGMQMEAPGMQDNISRLGIARNVLVSILEGTGVDVALHSDEMHEEVIVRFDANIPAKEQSWWRNFRNRVEEKQAMPRRRGFSFGGHSNLSDKPADIQGGHEIRP